MVWNKQKLKAAVVACFVALTLATNDFSFARSTQLHPILQQIAPLLRKIGIGVFCCGAAPDKSARVGLLEDMRFEGLLEDMRFERLPKANLESQSWGEKFRLGMEEEFRLGRIGIISFDAPSEAQFRATWDLAPKKAFLSFTRANLPLANKLKEALESKNYTVFIYLNEEGNPKYDPEFAGRMFMEADLRLVLDTPEARMSWGVRFEAALDEESRRSREDATRPEEGATRSEKESRSAIENAKRMMEGKPGIGEGTGARDARPGGFAK